MVTTITSALAIDTVPPLLGLSAAYAGSLLGLEFQPITVEVASRRGPSMFQMVGLAETAVREARIRIGSALSRLGLNLDEYALTVNLAPANVRKSGSGLDLAIAMALLGAIGHVEPVATQGSLFIAEVSLDGQLRPVPGVLPLLEGARNSGITQAFVAADNAAEASQLRGLTVHAASCLDDVIAHLRAERGLQALRPRANRSSPAWEVDLDDVRGQVSSKRALLLAAAGHHHLLLVGPPGAGKSLLARRLPGLLPALPLEDALQTTAIHSIAGVLSGERGLVEQPPFRSPHHTVSEAGLVGGGNPPRPGEISLAHHGVLFLDEMPEFRRGALEALRQPLEEHQVNIVRASYRTTFPARPLVVGAMNPCPCGNWGNPRAACRCSKTLRARYLSRISGPLLDRIDIHVLVPPVDLRSWSKKSSLPSSLSSAEARELVSAARKRQQRRFKEGQVSRPQNSLLSLADLERVAEPNRGGRNLLEAAVEKNRLSARGYVRVLRLARTLADLNLEDQVAAPHIGEALRYRMSDLAEL